MKCAIAHPDADTLRRLETLLLAQPDIEIVWTALSAGVVVTEAQASRPEILLLDIDLPGMSADQLTARIMAESPCSILLLNEGQPDGLGRVFDALGQGASDVALLPPPARADTRDGWADLLSRLGTLRTLTAGTRKPTGQKAASAAVPADPAEPALSPIVAIGASTGGPRALADVLSRLPADLPATVVIVQHLDFHFVDGLATWLDQSSPLPVAALTAERMPLEPGRAWVAGRPEHVIMEDETSLGWTTEWPDLVSRPSIDVLFKSIARYPAVRGCGVLLTGMGRDGAKGLLAMRQAGFHTIAQDEASSVVYGMPKAAAALEAADIILPVDDIAGEIVACIEELQLTASLS